MVSMLSALRRAKHAMKNTMLKKSFKMLEKIAD
jgi:hypothetical protein